MSIKIKKYLMAFSYYGGKFSLLNWILPLLDIPHICYVEPFGGSAAVLLNKKPSKIDVYNDIDNQIYTFFKVLRDHHEELIRKLQLTPYSLMEHKMSKIFSDQNDEIEKARKFFVNIAQSWGSIFNNTWERGKNKKNVARPFANTVDNLYKIVDRLRQVALENDDALCIIKKYDAETTLFYCDPPYYKTDQKYNYTYTEKNHIELLELLLSCKAKFAISTYDNELYNTILNNKVYKYVSKPFTKRISATKTQEVIYTNYPLQLTLMNQVQNDINLEGYANSHPI